MARLRLSLGATVTTAWLMTADTAREIAAAPRREWAYTISRSDIIPLIASSLFTTSALTPCWRIRSAARFTVSVARMVKTSALLGSRRL
jgi:hypothetical protein